MAISDVVGRVHELVKRYGAITSNSKRAAKFNAFGENTVICFPVAALFGERAIEIGSETLIGPYVSISAGMAPEQELLSSQIVQIGNRCLIGRHSSIVGHLEVVIEDDVYFGPNVYVTDQNHSNADPSQPIGNQSDVEQPVRIGAGSWLGANSVVLPGVTIGQRCIIGAGAVVTNDIPANSVAVGSPAKVIRTAATE